MRPTELVGRDVRDAEVADVAVVDEPRHRCDGLLDGDPGVGRVEVVEVDDVHTEPVAARRDGLAEVSGAAVGTESPLVVRDESALGGEDDLVAPVGDRPADKPLVVAHPVDVRRVDEVQAHVEARPNRLDRRLVVHPGREDHRPVADRRYRRAIVAESPHLHGPFL